MKKHYMLSSSCLIKRPLFLEGKLWHLINSGYFYRNIPWHCQSNIKDFLQQQEESFVMKAFKWCAIGKQTQTDTVAIYWELMSHPMLHLHDKIAPNNIMNNNSSSTFNFKEVVCCNTLSWPMASSFGRLPLWVPLWLCEMIQVYLTKDENSFRTPLDLLADPPFYPLAIVLFCLGRNQTNATDSWPAWVHLEKMWTVLPIYHPHPS